MNSDKGIRIVTGLVTMLDNLRFFLESEGCAKGIVEWVDAFEQEILQLLNEDGTPHNDN